MKYLLLALWVWMTTQSEKIRLFHQFLPFPSHRESLLLQQYCVLIFSIVFHCGRYLITKMHAYFLVISKLPKISKLVNIQKILPTTYLKLGVKSRIRKMVVIFSLEWVKTSPSSKARKRYNLFKSIVWKMKGNHF